jgi:hypothetical protein
MLQKRPESSGRVERPAHRLLGIASSIEFRRAFRTRICPAWFVAKQVLFQPEVAGTQDGSHVAGVCGEEFADAHAVAIVRSALATAADPPGQSSIHSVDSSTDNYAKGRRGTWFF